MSSNSAVSDASAHQCPLCDNSFGSVIGRNVHLSQSHDEQQIDQCYLDEIDHVATALDLPENKSPTTDQMDAHGRFSARSYHNRFGSWNNAVRECGREIVRKSCYKLSDEQLADELHRIRHMLALPSGTAPTSMQVVKYGKFGAATYIDHFGTWKAAAEYAGLDLQPATHRCYEDPIDYGPNWEKVAQSVRERDGHSCRVCGEGSGAAKQSHNVHHIQPARKFRIVDSDEYNYTKMNELSNLITVCPRCHALFEGRWPGCDPAEFAERARRELTKPECRH